MTLLCGTDLSDPSRQAAIAAGHLAAAWGEPLLLIHVMDLLATDPPLPDPLATLSEVRARQLTELGQQVSSSTGAQVSTELHRGSADTVLVGRAAEARASLIVVGAHGTRVDLQALLGSTAEHVARAASMPRRRRS